jgi:A/G-specific adenine glycosylase
MTGKLREKTTNQKIHNFQKFIWDFYSKNKRDLPWRRTKDPYKVLVSEVMLQQTQVSRGIVKYESFLKLFPTVQSLASTSTAAVLRAWQGLGYNRRALMLKKAAEIIVKDHQGKVPKNAEQLDALPGIGVNTAGSILAYAFNEPVVFIETNIRKIFLHHFFYNKENVSDAEILPYIEKSLDQKNPREWYWALMDYGVYLSKTVPNPNRKSKHYTRQSKFEGSLRQLRGKVIAYLLDHKSVSLSKLSKVVADNRLSEVLSQLSKEKFVVVIGTKIFIRE